MFDVFFSFGASVIICQLIKFNLIYIIVEVIFLFIFNNLET